MSRELMLCALSTALINQRGAGSLFILPRALRGEFEGVVAFLLLHLEGGGGGVGGGGVGGGTPLSPSRHAAPTPMELTHLSQVPTLTLGDLGLVSVKYFDTGEEVVSFSCAFHTMAPELRPRWVCLLAPERLHLSPWALTSTLSLLSSKATVEVRPGEADPRLGAVMRKCTTPLRVRRVEGPQEG
jgi:hypothetical protein